VASHRYNSATLAYALVVMALGLAAGIHLILRAEAHPWPLVPLIVLGGFSLGTTLLTITVQGFRRSKGVLSLSSATIYALLFLVDSAAVGLILIAMILTDWLGNRRSVLPGLFNVGQSLVTLWVALAMWQWLGPASGILELSFRCFGAAALAASSYALANHFLTAGVLVLATRATLRDTGVLTRTALFNEIVLVCFGLSLAYLWILWPPLALLALIPLVVLFCLLGVHHHREELLEARRDELASMQRLGLEIGALLDVDQLGPAVVRIAAEAFHAPGALLAMLSEDGQELKVLACRHPDPDFEPPARLPCRGFTAQFFEGEGTLMANEDDIRRVPEVAYLEARAVLAVALRSLGKPQGLLAVFDLGTRKPFTEEDAQRLTDLGRFVEMSLTNARLYADLKAVQEQLIQTEKLSAIGQLVSGVAHELNNPLTGVRGFAELLRQSRLDEHQQRMVEHIEKETARATRVVRNLLTFSRRHKPEKVPHDLNGILSTVVEMRAYECRVNNVELSTDLDPDLPRTMIDPHQMHQVFLNLLTNAEHAVTQSSGTGHIQVRSCANGETILVTVQDNGPGIDPENLKQIFDPFFTTKEVGCGTGLGLSICYGILQEHGGIIEVESQPGRGARFTVTLPVVEPPAREEVSEPDTPKPQLNARNGEVVLVVDDEVSVREIVREALEPLGFRVDAAAGGAEALARLQNTSYDLVLTDMRMPGMGGQELFEQIRRSDPELARRFIFFTGDVASPGTRQFLGRCGRPVLAKPFSIDQLLAIVSQGLEETLSQAAVAASSRMR
jgi:signal transduction histidine kinase/ActR/RegA family two-component response regulator